MIFLNRVKGILKKTNGFRKMAAYIYELRKKEKPFKVSRSKLSDYLTCKRCFYLDRVKGLKYLDSIPFTLNNAVDELCKKEFDYHREKQTPHPVMIENKINAVPFKHPDMEKWQNSLSQGVEYIHPNLNLKLAGGIDDVWLNLDTQKLIVVDYKAQSKKEEKKISGYLDDVYHEGYKFQLDFYKYLFEKNGFKVQETGYFVVYNATLERESFNNKLNFSCNLIAYKTDSSHIEKKIINMKKTMDSSNIPPITEHCQNCNYIKAGSTFL